jgi:3-oxoadipate enol-lactonase
MHFREQGSGTETILFLHGNLSSSRWWQRVFAFLPSQWRAIAVDLPGYGQSAAPQTKYGLEQMSADVAELCDHLQLSSFMLVGHSMGGGVALLHALQNQTKVRALVLIDPIPANGLHLPDEVFDLLEQMKSSYPQMKEGLRATAPTAPDDDFFRSLVEEALQSSPQAFREIPKSMAQFDVSARLNEIACPTLCIQGENDVLIPRADVERMCALIPDCTLVAMAGVGHCPPIEAPEELTRLLVNFLTAVPQPVP